MTDRSLFRLTCAAAVVAAALPASSAFAQQSASCTRLLAMVDEAGENELREEFRDARVVGETDDPNQCSLYVARVVSLGGLVGTADAAEVNAQTVVDTEQTTETIEIERQATIEGEVEVTLPDPQVQVEQDAAEIAVRTTPPEVNVSQGQPVIEIRQAQPIIRVQMAQPTITVEQPAPEITITMPEPGVDVATAQPVVEVNIPEPRVTVTQGQPRLNVDLDTEVGTETVADSNTVMERSDDGGNMVVRANGLSGGAMEPNIQYVQSEEAPVVNVSGAEPQVNYVAAEPQVMLEQAEGEPSIEIISSGEPKIMISGGDSDGMTDDTEAAPVAALTAEQRDPREAFAADEALSADLQGDGGTMLVGDLDGMDVRNARGEELGEVDRIVRNGNDTYVVVAHGGWFFGLNDKEIALPVEDITVRGGEVVLRGLTEEQIEAMPDYDYANEIALELDDEVTVQRLN